LTCLDGEAGHKVVGALCREPGISVWQRACAWAQRGAKAQPRCGCWGDGTSPGISVRRLLPVFIDGMDAIRARV
jgi:hypothetical protein